MYKYSLSLVKLKVFYCALRGLYTVKLSRNQYILKEYIIHIQQYMAENLKQLGNKKHIFLKLIDKDLILNLLDETLNTNISNPLF